MNIDDDGEVSALDVLLVVNHLNRSNATASPSRSAEPIDARVTLEHMASGQKTAWHDSLFSYKTALARSERFGHNFWSDEALEPLANEHGISVTVLKSRYPFHSSYLQGAVQPFRGSSSSVSVTFP